MKTIYRLAAQFIALAGLAYFFPLAAFLTFAALAFAKLPRIEIAQPVVYIQTGPES